MAWIKDEELAEMGFAALGRNVLISTKASIYNPTRICLGDHVRIDDFCVLSAGSGGIVIGTHIHIAVYTSLIGAGRITLGDYCNLSSKVSIYSSTDDFSGLHMTNPTIPSEYTCVSSEDVEIGRHVVIGSGTVVLPGVRIAEGAAVGALSLVKQDCHEFTVYAGVPARAIRPRDRRLLELETKFLADQRR